MHWLRSIAIILLTALLAGAVTPPINASYAPSNLPMPSIAQHTILVWTPSVPITNPFSSVNYVTDGFFGYPQLAIYNYLTGAYVPILARNWTEDPAAGTLIIYIRKGLSWYNGSATMPFTAWDAYAYFYIDNKAFAAFVPFINQNSTGIRVLNNYTLQIKFQQWSVQEIIYILTSFMSTPWQVYKPIVEALQGMNDSQALTYGTTDVVHFVPPFWFLSPYYVAKIAPPVIEYKLEPPNLLAAWDSIFPYHT